MSFINLIHQLTGLLSQLVKSVKTLKLSYKIILVITPVVISLGIHFWHLIFPAPDRLQADGSTRLHNESHASPIGDELPDGTRVKLDYSSTVQYCDRPDGKSREVLMTGQVAFEVTQNNSKPFVVHAGNTEIRVLGTYFNVMNYADEPATAITLIRGKIQISVKNTSLYLKPGEMALI
ncbi:MAG TPA: FecR domain-containing protein, partial [Puia sp.]